jgi:hypothetical protein
MKHIDSFAFLVAALIHLICRCLAITHYITLDLVFLVSIGSLQALGCHRYLPGPRGSSQKARLLYLVEIERERETEPVYRGEARKVRFDATCVAVTARHHYYTLYYVISHKYCICGTIARLFLSHFPSLRIARMC